MTTFWVKLRYRTHWRIYSRMLPVVAGGLLLVGFVSWQGYCQWTETTVAAARARGLADIAGAVSARATFAALNHEVLRLSTDPESTDAGPLDDRLVAGLLLEDGIVLCDSLDTPGNRVALAKWARGHLHGDECASFAVGMPWERTACAAVAHGPASRVVLHRPLTLEIALSRESPGKKRRAAVLPVAREPVATAATDTSHQPAVVLLDLSRLLASETRRADWWCLVGTGSEVLLAADDSLPTGSSLSGMKPDVTVAAGRPEDLLYGLLAAVRPRDRIAERNGLAPWTLSRHRDVRVPFEVMLGTSTDRLEQARLRGVALLAMVALILLLAGVTGVTHVVGDVSRRLTALGVHLRLLEGGDYDRRLSAPAADDVAELEDSYNRLAGRLARDQVRLADQAGRLDQAKDEFLVLVSHELRTPLTGILGGVDFLRVALADASPEQRVLLEKMELKEVVDLIAGSGDRLHGFLDDALRMASTLAGNRSLDLGALRTADVVSPALGKAAVEGMDRRIRLEDDLSGVQNWRILGDLDALQIVFAKLLENAVIHNVADGRVLLREVIEVPPDAVGTPVDAADHRRLDNQPAFAPWAEEEITWRTIEVRNTGPVIPADRLGTLFGRFEIGGAIANHSRGAGLGLAIARALVEEHGGRLAVRSDEERGTSFYVQLPAVDTGAVAERGALGDDTTEGVGGRTGDEEVGQVADRTGLEVELHDPGAGVPGQGHEPGGGIDGARGADHEEEVAVPYRPL